VISNSIEVKNNDSYNRLVEVTVNSKEKNSHDLRSRIRPLVSTDFLLPFQLRFRKVLEKKTSHTSEGVPPSAVFTSADPAETATPDGAAAPLNLQTISSRIEKNASMIPGIT
jgi:hypothetical protein